MTRMPKSKILRWTIVVAFSVLITSVLYINHLPAAFLLGPMLAGIILGIKNIQLSAPKPLFNFSQGILGCLTAEVISADVLMDLVSYWQLALIITISTILISLALGIFIARFSSLPGTTAIWSILPGGASVMVGICGDYGADPRLVALIQYLRVIGVILTLVVISHFFSVDAVSTEVTASGSWLPMPNLNLAYTIIIAVAGVMLTRLIRFPSGRVLIPMIIGATLQLSGLVQLETPLWLLALCFGTIGLSVGLRFNLPILKLAVSVLPIILLAIVSMLVFCFGQAVLVNYYLGIDYLTCFLATSPGGLDTSVIIALDTHSDFAVILPLQVLRLFSVLVFGPIIARYLSKKLL